MKKIFVLAILIVIVLSACGAPASAPTAAPQAQAPAAAATEAPAVATEAPAVATEAPVVATEAPVVATEAPTVAVVEKPTAAAITAPQQWNGTFSGAGMVPQNTSLLIEEMNGNSFIGKMTWVATGSMGGVITSVVGEVVTDFSTEESRWNSHNEYKKGDNSGTWLKWTETSFVSGTDAILGGWYYGHAIDGKMTTIMFANDTDPKPYDAKLSFTLVVIEGPDLPAVSSKVVTIDPAVLKGPHQWNGLYVYWQKQQISLIISEVNDASFKGQMYWGSTSRSKPALTKMEGSYVTDFGDTFEQGRWNFHEDYKNGDRSGVWLKWTETEMLTGSDYTMNGWYYAHIRTDGTMVGIYFYNPESPVPDTSASYTLNLAK